MQFSIGQVEEFTLSLDDRPGILADLCSHLAQHKVNLRAMTTSKGEDPGTVRLVVDDPTRARTMFDEANVRFTTAPCLSLEIPNSPGGLAEVARTLAVAGINIDSIYASASPNSGAALAILSVSDLPAVLALDWTHLGG